MSEETGSVEAAPEAAPEAGSSEPTSWLSGVDESIREDPSLADIKDITGLAKSYIHAQKMVGADKIVLPTETAEPEEWDNFYNRLGRPEKYEITTPKLPEGIEQDEPMGEALNALMHKAGLTNAQAQALHDGYWEQVTNQFNEHSKEQELQLADWDKEIRQDFGKAYDERIDMAQRAVREFGGEELKKFLENTGQGNNPLLIKMFAKIGEKMSEANPELGQGENQFLMTPDQARQEIARLQRDGNFMKQYHDKESDGHPEAIEKMQRLFNFAYPDEAVAM